MFGYANFYNEACCALAADKARDEQYRQRALCRKEKARNFIRLFIRDLEYSCGCSDSKKRLGDELLEKLVMVFKES